MRVAGSIDRIEILPETEEERQKAQAMIDRCPRPVMDGQPLIYWGDSDNFGLGSALIINTITIVFEDGGVSADAEHTVRRTILTGGGSVSLVSELPTISCDGDV